MWGYVLYFDGYLIDQCFLNLGAYETIWHMVNFFLSSLEERYVLQWRCSESHGPLYLWTCINNTEKDDQMQMLTVSPLHLYNVKFWKSSLFRYFHSCSLQSMMILQHKDMCLLFPLSNSISRLVSRKTYYLFCFFLHFGKELLYNFLEWDHFLSLLCSRVLSNFQWEKQKLSEDFPRLREKWLLKFFFSCHCFNFQLFSHEAIFFLFFFC